MADNVIRFEFAGGGGGGARGGRPVSGGGGGAGSTAGRPQVQGAHQRAVPQDELQKFRQVYGRVSEAVQSAREGGAGGLVRAAAGLSELTEMGALGAAGATLGVIGAGVAAAVAVPAAALTIGGQQTYAWAQERAKIGAEYSGAIAAAQAQSELSELMQNIRLSQENEGGLADFIKAQSDLNESWEDLKADLYSTFVPLVTEAIEILTQIVQGATAAWAEFKDWSVDKMNELIDMINAILAAVPGVTAHLAHINKNTKKESDKDPDADFLGQLHKANEYLNGVRQNNPERGKDNARAALPKAAALPV